MNISTKPTSLYAGTIPAGRTIRMGEAAGGNINGTSFSGGAQQIELLGERPSVEWFRRIK